MKGKKMGNDFTFFEVKEREGETEIGKVRKGEIERKRKGFGFVCLKGKEKKGEMEWKGKEEKSWDCLFIAFNLAGGSI